LIYPILPAQHAYKDLSFAVDLAAEAFSKVTTLLTAFIALVYMDFCW
jgi:hypothetical protein